MRRLLAFLLLLTITGARASAQEKFPSDAIPPTRMDAYSDLAVQWMQEYLRIDTTNPPGNEARATAWFKQIFDAEGIENKTFEYLPGRGDFWARIPHNVPDAQAKRPIVLLSHMDVVTSDATRWKHPPFSGMIATDEAGGPTIYGRGAQDMKCDGLAELMVMVMAKREKAKLDRDLIFLAVSDEEAEGSGTDWFIANQRPLLGNAEFLINEGGENVQIDGRVSQVALDTAEKSPFWLRVEAHGRPGHGSRPNVESAPNRLVAALDKILAWHTPLKMLPVAEAYMKAVAPTYPAQRRWFDDPHAAIYDPAFAKWVETDELINYMVRNTVQLTMLGGSDQTNVVPPVAWANLDVRLLPGEDQNAFLAAIQQIVNDPNVVITPQSEEFRVANSAGVDTGLFRSIQRASARYWPGAIVATKMTSGYDENQRYRPLGIESYGFSAYGNTLEEGATEHGNNERIRVEEVRRGAKVLYDVVLGTE